MHRVPVLERVGTLARKKRLTMPKLASFVVKEWSLFCFHSASRYSIERIKRLKSILKSLDLLLPSPLRLVTVGVALPLTGLLIACNGMLTLEVRLRICMRKLDRVVVE